MSDIKPIIVGIYGVPGTGKTTLKTALKAWLGESRYAFFDGSDVITEIYEGGLDGFRRLASRKKAEIRGKAIKYIAEQCLEHVKIGIVTGHLTLWSEDLARPEHIFTDADWETYTHILYLANPPDVIQARRQGDATRTRSIGAAEDIQKHQAYEMDLLRRLCYDHGVLLSTLGPASGTLSQVVDFVEYLLQDFFALQVEHQNESKALKALDSLMTSLHDRDHKTMLVLDGDRTLAPFDTGKMFWKHVKGSEDSLDTIFSSRMRYAYSSFRQASLLYETQFSEQEFDRICDKVAQEVTLYPEMQQLLKRVAGSKDTRAVVVSCGLRRVWEKVLHNAELYHVEVIGAGRIDYGYVVTGDVKASIVRHLRDKYKLKVWAIGDSTLDLPMLHQADNGVIVVGTPAVRSMTMRSHLYSSDGRKGLEGKTYQVTIPPEVSPLHVAFLPHRDLVTLVFPKWQVNLLHATDKPAAKLLATPMRDASVQGRTLQEAHRRVGFYLATEYLPDVLGGLEEHSISHVQGYTTTGHRLYDEERTLIIALMRGGEPMAFGVHDALPSASFLHATRLEDITAKNVHGYRNVVLVDSVINSGKTIAEHVNHIKNLDVLLRIAVVAGVVQAEAVGEDGPLVKNLSGRGKLDIVALRKSENKFTGTGGTDTGNRLFNTTHLE